MALKQKGRLVRGIDKLGTVSNAEMRSVKVQHKNPTSSQCSKMFEDARRIIGARNAKDKTLLNSGHRWSPCAIGHPIK